MRRTISAVALAAICLAAPTAAQPPAGNRERLVPRDEAAGVAGFADTLARFRRAVIARDRRGILAMLAPQILSSWEAERTGRGPAAFAREWKLDSPTSDFWRGAASIANREAAVLGDCTRLAASGDPQCEIVLPWWSARFPDDARDRFDYFVTLDNRPVFAAPAASSPVVATLSYDLVKRPSRSQQGEWEPIDLLDGRMGWMRNSDLYNPTSGYRMSFEYQGGRWVIADFRAGD